ncbi:MAG TPA: SDR family oxidoreductase [Beijerinckiaceae bacterium]|jgi:short-subunit dehydrogenase
MAVELKPVEEQVIVITGASSGIGRVTAEMAAARGARLVLAARNEAELEEVAAECRRFGGEAVVVPADVASREDLERIARTAIERFGGFDTWVNDAAVTIYGEMTKTPVEDQRRVFDVNYWGVVNGSLVAAGHLARRGGAIVNIGSVLSDRAMAYQAQYSATKHAVKAFTDGLRMELEAAGAPVSVTLIKPSAIDTPYPEHARNEMGAPGLSLPPPTYDPHLVGKAILFAAETPKRTLVVGFGGYMISLMGTHFPRLTDYAMEMTGYASQVRDAPSPRERQRRDNLYRPREGAEYSSLPETSPRKTSLFLEAQLHPMATVALLAGVGLALGYAFSGGGHRKEARNRASLHRRGGEREDLARVAMASYPTRDHDARRTSALARH